MTANLMITYMRDKEVMYIFHNRMQYRIQLSRKTGQHTVLYVQEVVTHFR